MYDNRKTWQKVQGVRRLQEVGMVVVLGQASPYCASGKERLMAGEETGHVHVCRKSVPAVGTASAKVQRQELLECLWIGKRPCV